MPIVFRVVSQDDYQAWLVTAKKKYAAATERNPRRERARGDAPIGPGRPTRRGD